MYRDRCRFVGLSVGALLVALVLGVGQTAQAQTQGAPEVDQAVLAGVAGGGETSYLVYMRETADLSGAEAIANRDGRGWFVYNHLREVADRTQGPILAALREEAEAGRATTVRSFLAANAIGVTSGSAALQRVAGFAGVARIIAPPAVSIPEPAAGVELAKVDGIEWNIAKVRAPEVWAEGSFGQGMVVANVDTGVRYNHAALVTQYRGNLGGGSFNHNYDWWDPSSICSPSTVPCDNVNHGTHTMGTMVGDDGGSNQIGVAPQAEWMACKGCETNSCSSFALLECGDFILAPWDLNGQNADPTMRPHVVNNSWGGGSGDSWYQGVVAAWRAAGIFPTFSIGNAGPGCGTAGSPGDYAISFASGATDISDNIASFSSRGPSAFGGIIKPDVTAPGVNVRSSIANGAYASFQGTSMASPHTAGIVALLWSRYPGLERDVTNTEKKLRPATRILNSSQGCGGLGSTVHPNHVYGWGRVDALQGWMPFNIYTNRSVFHSGDQMNVFLSLVNPTNSGANVDLYVAVQVPAGDILFYPGFTTTPTPFSSNFTVAPLLETFDFNVFNHVFNGEATGNYKWFGVVTGVGKDVFDSNNWLSLDDAPFTKN